MRVKSGMAVVVLHPPDEVEEKLGMPSDVRLIDDPGQADFVLDFATSQAEAEERLSALAPHLNERTVAWLGYPKGSKAAGYDLSRDTVWKFARTVGLELVANVAIDEKWSALRFKPVR
ncbi:MAG: hypothetical protein Kow00129_15270 [Thermoleophilia bacterium]